MKEKLAALSVLLVIIAVPLSILGYQYSYLPSQYTPEVKVFNITAVGKPSAAYTLETVNGLNYWWKIFKPMTILLTTGDDAVLNLRSSDISHRFYIPGLNLGPIDVKPGEMTSMRFTAEKPGFFQYFCTTLCGNCHFFMTGWIIVSRKGETPVIPDPIRCPACVSDFTRPPENDLIALGEHVYFGYSCYACHGIEGRGGVKNFNYAKKTIPAHNTTVNKLFLKTEEDAIIFNELLCKDYNLENLEEDPDIFLFNMVLARYNALKEIIKNGSLPEKLDTEIPEPPLWMPAWLYKLTEREIEALIAYFIDLYNWDED